MKKGYWRSHDQTYDPNLDRNEKIVFSKRNYYCLAGKVPNTSFSSRRKTIKIPRGGNKSEVTE